MDLKICDCMGCESNQECYHDEIDNEDKKYLWEEESVLLKAFENQKCPVCKWIYERGLKVCERLDKEMNEHDILWELKCFIGDMTYEDLKDLYLREMKRRERLDKTTKARFYTISPSGANQKDMTEDKLLTFARRIKKYYKDFEGVLEFGKHEDTPHLHIHYLATIRDTKNHMRQLKTEWDKIFKDNKALFNLKKKDKEYYVQTHTDCDKMIPYEDWKCEKLEYFKNELKGSHENFRPSVVI